MHAEDAQAADEGVDRDLEHVRQHVQRGVGHGVHGHGVGAFTAQEIGRIGLGRVGQQPHDEVEQLGHARAALGRDEHHRDEMPFAQRLLQRRVQLAGVDITFVEVTLDEGAVHLHHLLHQRAVGGSDIAEIALAGTVEKTIDDACGAVGGQVDGQTFLAEGGLQFGEQDRQVHAGRVDAVDDDQAGEVARRGLRHKTPRHRLDAGRGIDDDGRGFHRFQRRQAVAEEVGAAGGVEQVDARAGVLQVQHRGVQRMLHAAFQRVEVADGAAALDAAGGVDRAAACQQGFGQRGLARRRGAHQGQRAYSRGQVARRNGGGRRRTAGAAGASRRKGCGHVGSPCKAGE